MKKQNQRKQSATHENNVKRKMFFIVITFAITFVLVQFVKLSTIGRIGEQVSTINQEQDRLELENELLKAEISKLRTPSNLEKSLPEYGNFIADNVKVIQLNTSNPDNNIAQNGF